MTTTDVNRTGLAKIGSTLLNLLRGLADRFIRDTVGRLGVIILALSIYLVLSSPYFLTIDNARVLALGLSEDALMVVGMTVLIISGAFDLSIGAIVALTGVVAAKLVLGGVPVPLAFGLGILAGGGIGVLNGLLVAFGDLDALIATLGMSFVVRGLTLVITRGFPISQMADSYSDFGQGTILGVPNTILLMVVVVVISAALMRFSSLGRTVYYLGGNEEAAHLAGFSTKRIRIAVFAVMGLLTGLAGVAISSRLASAGPSFGVGTELRVIAAVVIGGASLKGGRGSIAGAMLGLLLMALITNVLILTGVSIYYQSLVTGIILLIAMLLDRFQNRLLAARRRTSA